MTYGTEPLLAEVSYVAYHFHWPFDEILDLEHPLRQAFVAEIGRIHEARATAAGGGGLGGSGGMVDAAALAAAMASADSGW
ncbi:MAG TPA: DUF6760 family protein [Actinocrinis sp.]